MAVSAEGQYDPDPSLTEVQSVPLETSRHGKTSRIRSKHRSEKGKKKNGCKNNITNNKSIIVRITGCAMKTESEGLFYIQIAVFI